MATKKKPAKQGSKAPAWLKNIFKSAQERPAQVLGGAVAVLLALMLLWSQLVG